MVFQNKNESKEDKKDNLSEQIKESGSVTLKGKKHNIHYLTVIGQIEGHGVLPSDTKTTTKLS